MYIFASVSVLTSLVILFKVMSLNAQLKTVQEAYKQAVDSDKDGENDENESVIDLVIGLVLIGIVVVCALCLIVSLTPVR